jgi:hypothetical protein
VDDGDNSEKNWIERKFLREGILSSKASEVWQEARSALENCCDSFKTHYSSIASIEKHRENGLRLRLELAFPAEDAFNRPFHRKRTVLIEFKEGQSPCIEITVEKDSPRKFAISADENRAFIVDGKELSFDEFAERALKSALFRAPEPTAQPSLRRSDLAR